MYKDLIRRIKERDASKDRSQTVLPPATEKDILDAEAALGFGLPPLLRALYLNIGNGGFGPGYGIIRLRGGHAPSSMTLVESYTDSQAGAKYLGFEWERGMLPFCEWGCAIFSCVDCTDAAYPIYLSETCDARRQDYHFEEFVEMWLQGVSILDRDTSPREVIEMTNPFTGEKTRIVGGRKKRKRESLRE